MENNEQNSQIVKKCPHISHDHMKDEFDRMT